MTQLTAGEFIRRWFEEVWNGRDAARIPALLAPHGVIHATDEEGGDAHGPEAFRVFHERMLAAYPDIHFTLHEIIEDGSRAAARWSATLTHCGEGSASVLGRPMTISGMSIIRVENGMGVEGWNEWDRLSLALACGTVARAG